MSNREPTSRKLRFDVFKRDAFICQYCGRHPPEIILEVDHISPVSEGGKTEIDNLVTSCFDCNRGKGKVPLSIIPQSLPDKAAEIQEKEAQLAGYRKILQAQVNREKRDCWRVADALIPDSSKTSIRKEIFLAIKRFLKRLDYHTVLEAAETANLKIPYSENRRFKYFCGTCWAKIRTAENEANCG